jgi:hypothetical protein
MPAVCKSFELISTENSKLVIETCLKWKQVV